MYFILVNRENNKVYEELLLCLIMKNNVNKHVSIVAILRKVV